LAIPPAPHEYLGHDQIATLLDTFHRWRGERRLDHIAVRANGVPGFGLYLGGLEGARMRPAGVLVLTSYEKTDQLRALVPRP
ncbi:MAG: hypothetical protein L0G99_13610, partial [Propionibacteriales bacterium]|nr:hypothetical protein [Propionibacteriales bacterium]